MTERLKKAIEKNIYWSKVYTHEREQWVNSEPASMESLYTRDSMDIALVHLQSSARWLTQVYEEETKTEVKSIGNLKDYNKRTNTMTEPKEKQNDRTRKNTV